MFSIDNLLFKPILREEKGDIINLHGMNSPYEHHVPIDLPPSPTLSSAVC